MKKSQIVAAVYFVMLIGPAALLGADEKPAKADSAKQSAKDSTAKATDKATDDASDDDPKVEVSKFRGRLPSGWGKLNVSDSQRQKIYKIQGTYAAKVDSLKKELADLQAKREVEMRGVLTTAQLKRLGEAGDEKSSKKSLVVDSKADPKSDDDSDDSEKATMKDDKPEAPAAAKGKVAKSSK